MVNGTNPICTRMIRRFETAWPYPDSCVDCGHTRGEHGVNG